MKIGTKVQTPHGPGTITKIEEYRKFNRYGVTHDNPNDHYRNGQEAFYFNEEIKEIKNEVTQ